MAFDINRLLTVLNNTGLQTKDNSLYQLLKQLIEGVGSLNGEVGSINNSISNINETITNTISTVVQLSLGTDSNDNSDSSHIPTSPTPFNANGIIGGLDSWARDGIDGTDGLDGVDGRSGIDGKNAVSLIPQDGLDGLDGRNGKDGITGADGKSSILLIPQDGIDGLDSLQSVSSSIPSIPQSQLLSNLIQYISGIGVDSSESEPNIIPFYLNAADIAMLSRTNEFRTIPGIVFFRVISDGEAQVTIWADKGGVSADTDAFIRFVIDAAGTLKGLMGYDQGLDRFVLGYNGNSAVRMDSSGNLEIPVNLSKYKGVDTDGWGLSAIYAYGRLTGLIAASGTIATYTVGAADGSFEVSINVNVTVSVTFAFGVLILYTDETNTAQTLTAPFIRPGGTLSTSIANSTGAGPYISYSVNRIRCKAATTITVQTSPAGNYTSVEFNVEADIKQLA